MYKTSLTLFSLIDLNKINTLLEVLLSLAKFLVKNFIYYLHIQSFMIP